MFFKKALITILIILSLNLLPVLAQTSHEWENKGDELYSQGKYDEALQCYNKALEINPENGYAWYSKGFILYKQEKYEEALKCYEKTLDITDDYGDAWKGKGDVLFIQGKYEDSLKCYNKALECDKKVGDFKSEPSLLSKIGNVYSKTGDYSGALDYYNKAIEGYKKLGDIKAEPSLLSKIGNVYADINDYSKALDYYNKSLEGYRKLGDEKGEASITGITGNVYFTLGEYSKALDNYNKALELQKKLGDSKSEASLLNRIGNVYTGQSDYEKALDNYNMALEIYSNLGDRKNESSTLNKIGNVYTRQGNYSEALDICNKALEINKENTDILVTFGNIYFYQGDYTKALDYYGRSLEIDKQQGDLRAQGKDLNNMGNFYYTSGNFHSALYYYNKALEISKEIKDIKGEANDLGNLGNVYYELGDYMKSLDYYNKSLEIRIKTGDLQGEGNDLSNMGNVYSSSGDYQKALEYYKKALEKRRTIGDKKGEAVALNNIAGLFVYSDDYSKALEYFNQSMDINKSAGIPCDVQEENIGEVYLLKGDLEKAYEKFSKLNDSIILGRYYLKKKEYGKAKVQFSKELSVYEKKRQADYLLAVYIGLGLSEEGVKNYEEGKKYYLKAVELIEHQRELLSQTQRKNFFEGKVLGFSRLTPYEGLVRIYHYLNLDSEGFLYGESTKARVFSEEMGRKSEGTEYKLPPDITKKERDLIQDIASVYKQIDSAYENNNQEKIKELEAELKQLKSEEETFISSLRKDYPEYASIMYPKPLKAEEINLKDGELLIEYEVTESNTFAWLVRKGKLLKTFDIQIDREDLEDLVKEYRTCFENVTEESDLGDFKPEKGKKLYELLLKDILSEAGKDKIIIIPDGILGILPFEGLVMEMPQNVQMKEGKYGPSPEGITYVGDSYVISYYQSASALTVMRNLNKGTAGKKDLFAMADPVFSVTDERLTGVMQANTLNQFQLARMDAIINQGFVSFNRLAFTGEMVKDLGKKFSSGLDSYTGVDASEKTVKSKKLNEYRYILFATHGILDKDVPYIKEPALVLSQVQTEDEDGFLTMGEVMNMNMGADVAILSACKTGLGKNISGEGIMGMGRAFQYAGVRGVLMSLWSVEERSTNMMIEKYLESLKEGKGNREALQEARNYIRKEGYTHPFYWAPFVLVGE